MTISKSANIVVRTLQHIGNADVAEMIESWETDAYDVGFSMTPSVTITKDGMKLSLKLKPIEGSAPLIEGETVQEEEITEDNVVDTVTKMASEVVDELEERRRKTEEAAAAAGEVLAGSQEAEGSVQADVAAAPDEDDAGDVDEDEDRDEDGA